MAGEKRAKSRRAPAGLLLAACLSAFTSPATAQNLSYVCENGDATRSVEVVAEPGYACRVKYSKASGTSYPWSARNESGYCGAKAVFLVDKLTSWGWQCDSADDVREIIIAHVERYHRHIKILRNVGKTCHFYPGDVQFGNLCGDERHEGVIVYSCEIDVDDWDQHLAVFLEIEDEPLIMEIGNSRSRQVTSYFVGKNRILVETQQLDAAATTPEETSIRCRRGATAWELYEQ